MTTIHDEAMGREEMDPLSPEQDPSRSSPCSEGSSDESQKSNEARKTNVSDLVTKSKKAASSLWTLLHAKVRMTRCYFFAAGGNIEICEPLWTLNPPS